MTPARSEQLTTRDIAEVLKNTIHYCFLGSLCPLIPIPFLDEWALNFVQRKLIQKAANAQGMSLSDREAKILAQGYEEKRGCLLSILLFPVNFILIMIIRPTKRLLRKITIFLAVKESADMFSRFVHHAVLTDYSARQGLLRPDSGDRTGATDAGAAAQSSDSRAGQLGERHLGRVANAVNQACAKMDTRPLNQAVRRILSSSKYLIVVSVTAFTGWIRRAHRALKRGKEFDEEFNERAVAEDAEQDEKLKKLMSDLSNEMLLRADYFDQLIRCFYDFYQKQLENESV